MLGDNNKTPRHDDIGAAWGQAASELLGLYWLI
jgi:hypothetical protein